MIDIGKNRTLSLLGSTIALSLAFAALFVACAACGSLRSTGTVLFGRLRLTGVVHPGLCGNCSGGSGLNMSCLCFFSARLRPGC